LCTITFLSTAAGKPVLEPLGFLRSPNVIWVADGPRIERENSA